MRLSSIEYNGPILTLTHQNKWINLGVPNAVKFIKTAMIYERSIQTFKADNC